MPTTGANSASPDVSTFPARLRAIRSSSRPATPHPGHEFAAADADCIFTRHGTIEAGQRFYQDVKGRLARYGRGAEELKVLPTATFVLGDTEAEALERCAVIRRQQVSGPTAILFLEQVWNRDLSGYQPDPDRCPTASRTSSTRISRKAV